MSNLIGYKRFAKSIATEAVGHLMSTEPYWGFSIRGARRSGRSSFFTEVSKHLNSNETLPINCFVGELIHATPEGFEQALLESINTSNLCSHDYSSFHTKVKLPEEFFVLCSVLYEKEGKSPVFLIDMGKSMDEQYSKRGMDGVIALTRLLRKIYNLLKEKNINLVLGIGLTTKFVRDVEEFAADVFVQRYESFITLKNTFFEGETPFLAFQQIVKTISGLEISDQYQGLCRGDTVTAGQLGENLKVSGTTEVTSQSLWQNLRGEWNILDNIQLEAIPQNELGELILADKIITDNRFPEYLESCDGGYRANDQLYETFSLYSPRRDPSITERIKRRVDDPDNDEVVVALLSSIGKSMNQLGLIDVHEPEVLGQKSGLMEAKVNEHTDPDLNVLEKELFQTAFPRKLITVACLTTSPAEEILQERLKEYAEKDCFILILFREGVDLGRIPLGRYINENIKSAKSQVVVLEEITSFLSNQDEVLLDEVNNWVSDAISGLFSKKPVLCVGHPTIKQLISGTINSGTLSIDSFAQHMTISKTDANKCLNFLVKPQILVKKKGVALWDPDNDVILKILLESNGNKDQICEQIKNLYTTDNVNIDDLVSLYQSISGNNELSGLTKDKILDHARENQDHQLTVIVKYLEDEPELNTIYSIKYETCRNRQLDDIEDITPYRTDILKLLEDVKSAKDEIAKKRDKNQQELSKKKEVLKQELVNHTDYFSDENKNELLHTIEGIRTLTSHAFIQTERKIHKQKLRVEGLKENNEKLEDRFNQLQNYSDKTEYQKIKYGLEQIQDLITQLSLDEAEIQVQTIDAQIVELEKLKERQAILDGSPVVIPGVGDTQESDGSPDTTTVGPPDLGGSPDTTTAGPSDLGDSPDTTTVGPPGISTLPSTELFEKEQMFDISNLEERKALANTLILHKGRVLKIDVQVDL